MEQEKKVRKKRKLHKTLPVRDGGSCRVRERKRCFIFPAVFFASKPFSFNSLCHVPKPTRSWRRLSRFFFVAPNEAFPASITSARARKQWRIRNCSYRGCKDRRLGTAYKQTKKQTSASNRFFFFALKPSKGVTGIERKRKKRAKEVPKGLDRGGKKARLSELNIKLTAPPEREHSTEKKASNEPLTKRTDSSPIARECCVRLVYIGGKKGMQLRRAKSNDALDCLEWQNPEKNTTLEGCLCVVCCRFFLHIISIGTIAAFVIWTIKQGDSRFRRTVLCRTQSGERKNDNKKDNSALDR